MQGCIYLSKIRVTKLITWKQLDAMYLQPFEIVVESGKADTVDFRSIRQSQVTRPKKVLGKNRDKSKEKYLAKKFIQNSKKSDELNESLQ